MNPSSSSRGECSPGLRSGRQQALLLALLPLDPRRRVVAGREPGVDRRAKLGVAAEPARERELGEVEAETPPELAQRAEPVQLGQPVLAVAAGAAPRHDEALLLEVPE